MVELKKARDINIHIILLAIRFLTPPHPTLFFFTLTPLRSRGNETPKCLPPTTLYLNLRIIATYLYTAHCKITFGFILLIFNRSLLSEQFFFLPFFFFLGSGVVCKKPVGNCVILRTIVCNLPILPIGLF